MSVSQNAILGLVVAIAISFAPPFVIFRIWRGRMALSSRNIALGAGVFVLFAVVLEGVMNLYVLKLNPTTSDWLNHHVWGFVLYAVSAAALYAETGRYLALRFFVKRVGNPGTAVAYGIGHGGIESIIIALVQVWNLCFALMLNAGTLDVILGSRISAAAMTKMRDTLIHLDFAAAAGGVERGCAILMQIAMSLLVWRAVERRQWRWFVLALIIHAGIDSVPALHLKGQVSLFVTESVVFAIGAALLLFFVVKIPPADAQGMSPSDRHI
jgi:uncharacterized membrane protein YhfC